MTLKEKCELWLKAAEKEHISDNTFDILSWQLAKRYDKLPKWFIRQVPLSNLECGSTLGLSFHKGD